MIQAKLVNYKKQYNEVLLRCENAAIFLDNPAVSEEKKEKWFPEFLKILGQAAELIESICSSGYVPSDQEALNGFFIEEGEEIDVE